MKHVAKIHCLYENISHLLESASGDSEMVELSSTVILRKAHT